MLYLEESSWANSQERVRISIRNTQEIEASQSDEIEIAHVILVNCCHKYNKMNWQDTCIDMTGHARIFF